MKLFVPLDIETTGLDPREDYILEIAWVVTDEELNELTPRRSFIVDHGDEWGDVFSQIRANEFIRYMHQKSGLAAELFSKSAYPLSDIAASLVGDISDAIDQTDAFWTHLLGNSVDFDRNFLSARSEFEGFFGEDGSSVFHHRVLDLSSLKLMFELCGIPVPTAENPSPHRALTDMAESLGLARQMYDQLILASNTVLN